MHIFNSTCISDRQKKKANKLLISFVDEFEHLYGERNMGYNVHQLKHLGECVKRNGPLFGYSNYPMEDYIGHLVSIVNGTTDVTSQICTRYLLEKNLYVHLQKSQLAHQYYEEIESKLFFPIARKVNGSLVIGKAKEISELNFIRKTLRIDTSKHINEYRAAFLNNRHFYEVSNKYIRIRTYDSLVFNSESNCFAEIRAILLIEEQLYFLLDEKFRKISDKNCKNIHFLGVALSPKLTLISPEILNHKFVFIEFANTKAASKLPNLHERN